MTEIHLGAEHRIASRGRHRLAPREPPVRRPRDVMNTLSDGGVAGMATARNRRDARPGEGLIVKQYDRSATHTGAKAAKPRGKSLGVAGRR